MTDDEWKRRFLELHRDISEQDYDRQMAELQQARAELDLQWVEGGLEGVFGVLGVA